MLSSAAQQQNGHFSNEYFFTQVGKAGSKRVQEIMVEIDRFIQWAMTTEETETLELRIAEYYVKRQVAKEVQTHYKHLKKIFTEFQKHTDVFYVKKWKKRTVCEVEVISLGKKGNTEASEGGQSGEAVVREQVNRELGFSLVMEMLMEAKKPMVGHNMIYDMLFFYSQFIADLPATYSEFAQEVINYYFIFYLLMY